jgi:hypothetical protein
VAKVAQRADVAQTAQAEKPSRAAELPTENTNNRHGQKGFHYKVRQAMKPGKFGRFRPALEVLEDRTSPAALHLVLDVVPHPAMRPPLHHEGQPVHLAPQPHQGIISGSHVFYVTIHPQQ